MKLTILEVGKVPDPLLPEFGSYPKMFEHLFDQTGADMTYETVYLFDGEPLPDLSETEAILVPGSAAGVYDDYPWMEPLRDFIRAAYGKKIPMIGVCFGHQVIAEALGGDVRKSEKGWGIGRHVYDIVGAKDLLSDFGSDIAIAASHQDQVITPPDEAEVFLKSEFTPNAGLIYKNGVTLTVQPHPEFAANYSSALAELRRGTVLTDAQVEAANTSLQKPLQGQQFAQVIVDFLKDATP